MAADPTAEKTAPVLLCFDGSDEAAAAIAKAGELMGGRAAVVLTVWEPIRSWAAYDPATILTAPLSHLASAELGLDEIAAEAATERNRAGVDLARAAGFDATGRVEHGKPRTVICQAADELGAGVIVVGARGLGRVESALLGSVSAAVVAHSTRPVFVVHHRRRE
jgi:nucleotide-binding universal stress UspA family protein